MTRNQVSPMLVWVQSLKVKVRGLRGSLCAIIKQRSNFYVYYHDLHPLKYSVGLRIQPFGNNIICAISLSGRLTGLGFNLLGTIYYLCN